MIKLQPDPTFIFEIKLYTPGQREPVSVKFRGKHMDQPTVTEWANRLPEQQGGAEVEAKYLAEALDGWIDVIGADDKPEPFNVNSFTRFLKNYPGTSLVIFKAYLGELGQVREKN